VDLVREAGRVGDLRDPGHDEERGQDELDADRQPLGA
jgi:hypothetical protein